MSYVATDPEALIAAANNLEAIGSALTAQNQAAAMPTTGIVPAAADPISALQATQFDAYGALYQQVSAQATAIRELFVHTLHVSADSYGATEAANSVAAAPSVAAPSGLLDFLTGNASASPTVSGALAAAASNSGILTAMNGGNIGSAASEFTGLGKGFITNPPGVLHGGAIQAVLASEPAPASLAAATSARPAAAVPVSAGLGQASPVGAVSAPPGWTGETAPVAQPGATLTGTGWTATTAPHGAPTTAVSTGMPAVASADRGGYGYGKPRYGVKPTVMSKPAVA